MQILDLIQQLPPESQQSLYKSWGQSITQDSSAPELDAESQTWLKADLADELPEYDWGPEGIPKGASIVCIPEQGIVTVGADEVES